MTDLAVMTDKDTITGGGRPKLVCARLRVRLSLIGLAAVLAAGSFIASAAGASPAAASTAAIALEPSFGPPTTKVVVGGSGYRAGETVAIFFDLSRIGSAVADRAG